MSSVDTAFANTAPQGVLPTPQPAPQGGVLGGVGGALGALAQGVLAIPQRAIGNAVSRLEAPAAQLQLLNDEHMKNVVAMQTAYAQMARQMAAAKTIHDSLADNPVKQAAFDMNWEGWTTPTAMKGGDSFVSPLVGTVQTAPQIDQDSGFDITGNGQGGLIATDIGLPGKKTASDGVLTDSRRGLTGQTYSQPQKLAPGETPGAFTPTVNGVSPSADAPQDAPANVAEPSASAEPVGDNHAPRGIRNNNWGNLTQLPNGQQWAGQTGVDKGGYVTFATPQDGLRAAITNLQSYATKHGLNTVSGIAARWAPQAAGNDSDAYARTVAQQMGVGVNDPLNMSDPRVLNGLVHGISVAENGKAAVDGALAAGATPSPPQSAPQQAPTAAASGWTVGQPAGGGYRIVPGNQVPGGKPNWTYKVGPNGDMTPIPPDFTMADVQSNRKAFLDSEQYKSASTGLAALGGLDRVVSSVAPGGVVGMASLDTLNKALNPGGVVRPQTAQMFLDHLGLPEEMRSHISGLIGNGPLSPAVIKQVGQAAWSYSKSHVDQANERAQSDVALAVGHGFKPEDAGETAPQMPPVPIWAQDPLPPVQQRIPNHVYWSAKGPVKWTPKGWVMQ